MADGAGLDDGPGVGTDDGAGLAAGLAELEESQSEVEALQLRSTRALRADNEAGRGQAGDKAVSQSGRHPVRQAP